MALRLNEMRDRLVPEGSDLDIYFGADQPPPAQVDVELQAQYDDDGGKRTSKSFKLRDLPCTRMNDASAFTVKWKANLAQFPELKGRLVQAVYVFKGVASRDSHGIVAIDVTQQPELTRIMLHEFSKTKNSEVVFDPMVLNDHLDTLTVQQKRLLLNTALEKPNGRLVTFVTLDPPGVRMNADFSPEKYDGIGVLSNATFSVFHCRNEARLGGEKSATPKATSPITLVCHTRYFVLNLSNGKTSDWITKQRYEGRTPNQWLKKDTEKPVLFKIGALKPAEKVSNGVLWHAIHEPGTGKNIMAGNSVHGMINTVGCWMLFRNFNWPRSVRDELDRIYRHVYRRQDPPPVSEVVAELRDKAGYDVPPATQETQETGYSSSYDKFIKYDRNWAYQWFCHEVIGIRYFSDTDRWGFPKTANDYNVHGRTMSKKFPLAEAGGTPAYNDDEELGFAYHNFSHRKLTIGPNLFRTNALGFKTASEFIETMDAQLSKEKLESCSWSDIYFFKERDVNAEKMTSADVREPKR